MAFGLIMRTTIGDGAATIEIIPPTETTTIPASLFPIMRKREAAERQLPIEKEGVAAEGLCEAAADIAAAVDTGNN